MASYREALELFHLSGEVASKVPWELSLLWDSENYNGALLWPGGILNQPHLTMNLLDMCRNIRYQVKQVERQNADAMAEYHKKVQGWLGK